ncbi:MAG: BREX-1 system phosphatase PglZ type A, partial [Candidatus Obscuribacterales bacterium]|nr:BREX-1 system phosphatase PglZ type A [Candidatus Obscuribacterales bacterium]
MEKILQALEKLFEKHRIVFWYDVKRELGREFETLCLDGVEKVVIDNNEFSLKYRLIRKESQKKFLLFHSGPPPELDVDNWLLDVQLCSGDFRADQVGLWLSELELSSDYFETVQLHSEFFHSTKRIEALKRSLSVDDTPNSLRMKMLAVCANSEPRLDAIIENLLVELSDEKEERFRLIERIGLRDFFLEQLKKVYGYESKAPSLKDFVIRLFKSCYSLSLEGRSDLSNDALVFLKRWKDSRNHEKSFEALSDMCTDWLNVESDLNTRYFKDLVEIDYFRLIDLKILSDLVAAVVERTISSSECSQIIRQRRNSHWYRDFSHLYECLDVASQFVQLLDQVDLSASSLVEGIQRYKSTWYRVDQLYRKFVYH